MAARQDDFDPRVAEPLAKRLLSALDAKLVEYHRLRGSATTRARMGSTSPVPDENDVPVSATSTGSQSGSGGKNGLGDLENRVRIPGQQLQALAREIQGIKNQLAQCETAAKEYKYNQSVNRGRLQESSSKLGDASVQSFIDAAGRIVADDELRSDKVIQLIRRSYGRIDRVLYQTGPPAYETASELYSDQLPEELQSDTSGRGDYVDETLAALAAYSLDGSDDHTERPAPGLGDPADRSDSSLTDKLYLGRAYTQYEPHQVEPMLLPPAHGRLRAGGYSLADLDGRYTLFPRNPY